MSGEHFYHQQGMSKTDMQLKTGKCKPKRRLKADITKSVSDLLGIELKSLGKMTVADLTTMESILEEQNVT